jgi:hypothetical protein
VAWRKGRLGLCTRAAQETGINAQKTVTFRDVEVLRDTGTDFLCAVATTQVWVPLTEIRYGTELTKIGDHGRLIVSRWFAQTVGLR